MTWVYLSFAIALEIAATMALRASDGFRRLAWVGVSIAGYVVSFVLLSLALSGGIALGVAYGVWSAVGIAGTAIIARFAFKEPLNRTMIGGIALVMAGVLLVELGSHAS
ncbi:multidrug efflux SMR transporter [Actinoplanes sp. NBRC 103695]|uniref:DMT family transporter n=1 Tax=Actinoplanes sp. NBRC 103695 TaxID=3032202 RepID=UPI00249F96DD|nr:multidrug efflux SMR transporter [Actinoplanes sp. NBRC 103695]GLZ00219.1 QacE family quaternary ammonium compound efflux SMR transporter [Actinoplanes sp. NBRC 103695]